MRSLIYRCLLLTALLITTCAAQAAKPILVLGDSLSAGYGISQETSWPTLLDKRLQEKRLDYNVANVSISGETTSGGRSRLDAVLVKHRPAIVIIALGSNDGLRGLPIATILDNLIIMAEKAQNAGARVLIVGQRMPPNYGDYAVQFHEVFGEVAQRKKTALVDFLLDGVADQPKLFQSDNMHPIAEAQPRLLDNVWKGLEPLLK